MGPALHLLHTIGFMRGLQAARGSKGRPSLMAEVTERVARLEEKDGEVPGWFEWVKKEVAVTEVRYADDLLTVGVGRGGRGEKVHVTSLPFPHLALSLVSLRDPFAACLPYVALPHCAYAPLMKRRPTVSTYKAPYKVLR